MGKTSQPLYIMVSPLLYESKEVQALIAKGHQVEMLGAADTQPDLILHPAAVGWGDEMWPYLEVTLKAARARRYPEKRKKKEDKPS